MQGGPSSVHKLPLVSIRNVLHITNNLKTLYEKFNIVVKPQKYRHNIEINCTYVNLGLLLPFLSNLGSIHGHFIRFCYSLSVRCCFPTQNEARQLTLFSLNSQISPASKNRAPIHHESAKSLRPGQPLISSPFYIRSSNWIIPNTAQAQSVDYLRVGRSMFCHAILILPGSPESMFEFTTQHLVIEVPERTSDCSEPKTIKKISLKNTSKYDEGRLRDWP